MSFIESLSDYLGGFNGVEVVPRGFGFDGCGGLEIKEHMVIIKNIYRAYCQRFYLKIYCSTHY